MAFHCIDRAFEPEVCAAPPVRHRELPAARRAGRRQAPISPPRPAWAASL
jgi:hypothetical protein